MNNLPENYRFVLGEIVGPYNGTTPISNDATIGIWYEPYGAPQQAVDLGYDVINSQNVYKYIVPTLYGDYLNSQFLYNEWEPIKWEPIKWENTTLPLGHPLVKGGMFSMWNDVSDANGLSMDDAHIRLMPGIQVVAEKILNRYPYDANRPIDPMKTLIKQIEE